jgi:8-oxo-dGTP pyrophosphatase MutT (NUDIX family)
MNPHEKLLREIENFQPSDAKEAIDKQKLIEFIKTTPAEDRYVRTNLKGHITGSALLLSPDMAKTLLTHHAFLNKWLQFGGHADGDPDIAGVALRETQEESGIDDVELLTPYIVDIDVHEIPDRPERNEPAHIHYDIRYITRAKTVDFKISEESHNLRWFDIDALATVKLDLNMNRMIAKWQDYLQKKAA